MAARGPSLAVAGRAASRRPAQCVGVVRRLSTSVPTRLSKSNVESRLLVRSLYRDVYRAVPDLLRKYEIQDISTEHARANLNALFRRYGDVSDVSVAEVLRQKGIMDLDEANRMFKTRSHVYKTITEAAPPAAESRFLDNFYKA